MNVQQETQSSKPIQGQLKLRAGKLEVTKDPKFADPETDSSAESEVYDSLDDNTSMSAVTPSPGHIGDKLKQKSNPNNQQRRNKNSKGRRR
jgi:hypothetical protein